MSNGVRWHGREHSVGTIVTQESGEREKRIFEKGKTETRKRIYISSYDSPATHFIPISITNITTAVRYILFLPQLPPSRFVGAETSSKNWYYPESKIQ